MADNFDVIVIGAGHAGCEAAYAAARLGRSVAICTLTADTVAHMPCNPAIGGTAKGHLVAEIDALKPTRVEAPYPGGESYRQVVERTREFLADLLDEFDGRRVLVIAHAANRWSLQHLLLGEPLEELVVAPFAWQEGWVYPLDGERLAQG